MNDDIRAAAISRGVRRICHFTPSRNLLHIAAGKVGILSTAALESSERKTFNRTDLARLDRKTTHICCSIEYPNAWYFSKARTGDQLFLDWVVLLISPSLLWQDDVLFCPRNAAAEYGRYITDGIRGFNSLFAERVRAGNQTYIRKNTQLSSTPTDQQAEVLVRERISPSDILAVGVKSEDQAKTERVRLRLSGVDPDTFQFVVAPHFYEKYELSRMIHGGITPAETPYPPLVGEQRA